MEILGVGPMELILILIIALIVLGPNDMVKAGKTLGRWMRRVVTSPQWAAITQIWSGMRTLPNRLMREAGLEDQINDLRQTQDELRQQVNEVMKIKAPLLAGAKEIDQEARSIGGDLSAWTTNRSAPGGAASAPSGLSAWITPPQAAAPAQSGSSISTATGTDEVHPTTPATPPES